MDGERNNIDESKIEDSSIDNNPIEKNNPELQIISDTKAEINLDDSSRLIQERKEKF